MFVKVIYVINLYKGVIAGEEEGDGLWLVHTFPQLGTSLRFKKIFSLIDWEDWKAPISEQRKAYTAMCSTIDDLGDGNFQGIFILVVPSFLKTAPVIQKKRGEFGAPKEVKEVEYRELSSFTTAIIKVSKQPHDIWQYLQTFGKSLYVKTPYVLS